MRAACGRRGRRPAYHELRAGAKPPGARPRRGRKSDRHPCRSAAFSFVAGRYPRRRSTAMSRMLFASLPVADLAASMDFYEALGFTNNAQFTDDTAACMVWSDSIFVMLLTHEKWR